MALQDWELQQRLATLLPLSDGELAQIISRASELSTEEACAYLTDLLGNSEGAKDFVKTFRERRSTMGFLDYRSSKDNKETSFDKTTSPPKDFRAISSGGSNANHPAYTGPRPPSYAPPPGRPPGALQHYHSNPVIEAAKVRARDEQEMQQMLQNVQFRYGVYNSDIEPEHDTDYPCNCAIHIYAAAKWRRYGVQDLWSKAVIYPGEKVYDDSSTNSYGRRGGNIWSRNPYTNGVVSPYGYYQFNWGGPPRPNPEYHARSIHQTIALNNRLNREAQANLAVQEPDHNIWAEDGGLETVMSNLGLADEKSHIEKKNNSGSDSRPSLTTATSSTSRLSSFRRSIGMKSSTERAVSKVNKAVSRGVSLRDQIVGEERGRWPDAEWQQLVLNYQDKVGMTKTIAEMRIRQPIEYLHLLRAGYFEPIPVAWANQASNPLKFSIEAAAGWRGITPAWRGYEDTAEERLYWVLNHREDPTGATRTRLKPDFISEMDMARARMASAIEPPPLYFAADDTCHLQHTSEGYSVQVAPPPLRVVDRPELPTDDTMILLDVSGSMDFDPVRPIYAQYLITSYARGTQPKNKDVAKAIVRRFTDAMTQHDHLTSGQSGYDLVTFSSSANYIGSITHSNLDALWASRVHFGGGTRVMTGWQKCKDLHFRKHSASATHHPVYGWQAGPETPILRLLLLLDGEATDMDEFELDLLSLSWAHVTIFLIGVEGCPHHHRHANELQRISDVNPHVSFVDAQGNTPERYVTHELLKRHLGYDISMTEFEEMETLPAYQDVV